MSSSRAFLVAMSVRTELGRFEVGVEAVLEGAEVLDFDVVEQAVGSGEEDGHLLFSGERLELRLLEKLGEALAAVELALRDRIEVRAELREGCELAILRKVELERGADLLGRLDGGRETDARDRETDVDGRTDAGVEEVGLEEDLAVGDGDDVGRNVGRDVAGLGLDDGQRGERTAAELVGELGAALEQTGMEIEDVAGVGFASWRTAEEQRDFAVAGGVLGEVVVDDEGVLAGVAEVLAHGGGGEGREVLHRRGLGRSGGDDDGVGHGAMLFEGLDDLRDGRPLLPDGAVDADEVVLRGVDDGVERDGGLAGLAVADDELALAAADGDHGVDGLDAGGHGLADGLAIDDAGSETLDGEILVGVDGALVVDGLAERVDDAADHGFADGHGHDACRCA